MANALSRIVVRPSALALWLVSCLVPLQAATLERLSLDDMILKSTAIVRGKVTGSNQAYHASVIFTQYNVQVLERWKGASQTSAVVMVPGGRIGAMRQSYPGAPRLEQGQEYLLFLWSSRQGINYVIGFSQGLFELPSGTSGEVMAVRRATGETMLDPSTGQQVKPEAIQMRLRDLSDQITRILGKVAMK
jgi:hypothetical protein